MTLVVRSLRVLVGGVLIAAGIGKLASEHTVRLAPMILGDASGPIMRASTVVEDAVPALEILAGLAFLAGIGRVARTLIGLILGAIFVVAAMLIPAGVRCGCLGILGGFESRAGHLAVSGALTAATVLIAVLESRRRRISAMSYDDEGYDRPHRSIGPVEG